MKTAQIKERYPEGCRVKLVYTDDVQAPPKGTKGTVRMVDDMGTVHVDWDNGSSLGVCLEEDRIQKIKDEKPVVRYRESGASRFKDKKEGLFYYELRSADEGNGYSIERHVVCNNIGSMVTDRDILGDAEFITAEELFLRYEMINDPNL